MNRNARRAMDALVVVLSLAVLMLGWNNSASATGDDFPDTEVTVCWEMDAPNMADQTSIEWPQHWIGEQTCPTLPASCKGTKFQQDTYWIRDNDDQALLFVTLATNGLTSPADDAPLEPHNYSVIYQAADPSLCPSPPVKAHARVTPRVIRNCDPRLATVWLQDRVNIARSWVRHPYPFMYRWAAVAKPGHTFPSGATRRHGVIHVRPANGCHTHGS